MLRETSLYVLFSLSISSFSSWAADLTQEVAVDGLKSSVMYVLRGSYLQFHAKNNLVAAALAAPSLWYSFEEDKRITFHEMKKKIPASMQLSSDLAPVLSFPILPIAFYTYGIQKDSSKAVGFAMETFATMYLALLESAAISLVDIHQRPNPGQLSKWETNFRGNSSFPSGHVIPFATLALKTYQFYGPVHAIAPTALLLATSIQRVRDGKHYLSDVVGGFFLTVFASEGVRKAASTDKGTAYHSFFKQPLRLGYAEHRGVLGPSLMFEW